MLALAELGAAEAAAAIRAGDISAQSLVDALLDRCTRAASLNAFISLDPDAVRNAARSADQQRQRGERLGPLHGVPIALKDNFDTADFTTTAGTPALAAHRPTRNAAVVQRLLDAGALILGKANMQELAFGPTSNNAAFGPVRNPYDRSRIPGGSSGGTAALVAARLAPAGLGTDTGGSVRVPASLSGVVGFRPTTLRWPQDGIVPISHTRDTAAPIARCVADCALLDGIVTGGPTSLTPINLEWPASRRSARPLLGPLIKHRPALQDVPIAGISPNGGSPQWCFRRPRYRRQKLVRTIRFCSTVRRCRRWQPTFAISVPVAPPEFPG